MSFEAGVESDGCTDAWVVEADVWTGAGAVHCSLADFDFRDSAFSASTFHEGLCWKSSSLDLSPTRERMLGFDAAVGSKLAACGLYTKREV